ncbi:MAG: transporter [Sulfurimonas sp. RIFOXYD12_FULL_33_39]|uniref:VF530 family protein n=1 Tax=unclassified Sulfurimonas TaxID=2623549 RepID=UPI0008C044B8|nr:MULTISPECIES: VF530 family protein [unclassified Sulfurimonas]OHE09825.1 MAG: transporter [Sulfurimonas sp. RIFOXYD12_FULL_33_39]OHE13667.1 MAG: transporter [Sulfurimonas sp. RIFOXYD2_FULL_34_21]DAB28125.1 MAG TPA: transporter [Sulfurimonas sp. UBA10385]
MSEEEKNKNNPLHGIKLQYILETLVERYGFKELSNQVDIRCFLINPTISSCLKFLRKTPWARAKVEEFYIKSMGNKK